MASNFLSNLTPEERIAIRQAAQEERDRIIKEAIKNGASVSYTSCHLTQEEWETHILYGADGICTIDTTIPGDIKQCIRKGWTIKNVTYYSDTKTIAGITCESTSNHISIRSIRD